MVRGMNGLAGGLMAVLLLGGMSASAGAAQDTELSRSVARLGELNGVALACNQGALAARLREIMVDTAPKERGVGEVFENATNESFLAFGRAGRECPDGRTLAEQIDRAREALERAKEAQP
ncbi:MAG: hypothetical protein AB7U81_04525 [Thiohalomonadaceae bacterium]